MINYKRGGFFIFFLKLCRSLIIVVRIGHL